MLAFMSGWLGEEVLSFLLEINHSPEKIIIPSEREYKIIELCQSYGVEFIVYRDGLQESLAVEYDGGWLISIWSSIKIKKTLIDKFDNTLNIHPSMLPVNKGSDCAAWSIRNKTEAGVSIITLAEGIDDGDIYCQEEVKYEFPTPGKELQEELLKSCLNIFKNNWHKIYVGEIKPKKAEGKSSYYTRRQTNIDRVKSGEEQMSIEDTINWILAHDFGARSSAEVVINGEKYKLSVDVK